MGDLMSGIGWGNIDLPTAIALFILIVKGILIMAMLVAIGSILIKLIGFISGR